MAGYEVIGQEELSEIKEVFESGEFFIEGALMKKEMDVLK